MYVSESDYHYCAQIGTTKRYLAGEYIFTRGELASTVYLIKSGRVLVTTSLGDGRMLTFSVLKKGSIFGDGAFADHYLREVDISAVTDVEVIVCETKDLLPLLCENQALLLMLLRHMAELSNEMAHQLVRLAHYDGKQKVVDYILVNAGATGSLPYTHNDIANCLGMNRVTVSRIMQELRAEGLLNYAYRKVTVLDRDGLEEVLNNLE